ncbi:Insulin-like growth factor 2 mRNA-binding protein 1 [Frankliniella fusca]|uniref:Insulin-like growth factor 2 mRNA-binding protein 1 n=1 Tax=Frankliniella fusca TaxID=407009 RepID=A0AAE1LMF0_9NEOP|nr:Insulin-like growth factor 2 mRNA-binding protein 1 [Frankliniella fusca]
MSKLYVGNLDQDVTEQALRQLLDEHGIACGSILVKRGGYAFVDCPDQSAADKAIDKLNEKWQRPCGVSSGKVLMLRQHLLVCVYGFSGL